jgi:4-amino-4-deoxy-L-arabinose transferase
MDQIELYKCLLAAIAFAVWALMGWLAMKDAGRRWSLAALCPLGLALLVGFAIPDRVIDSKQPQFLVDIVSESLQPSRYVLTNNVGIAGGLAWELKRSDIIMFDKQGELKYGLDWPDAQEALSARPVLPTGWHAPSAGAGLAGAVDG